MTKHKTVNKLNMNSVYELLNITTQHQQLARCKQTNSTKKTRNEHKFIANNVGNDVVLEVKAIKLSIFMSYHKYWKQNKKKMNNKTLFSNTTAI